MQSTRTPMPVMDPRRLDLLADMAAKPKHDRRSRCVSASVRSSGLCTSVRSSGLAASVRSSRASGSRDSGSRASLPSGSRDSRASLPSGSRDSRASLPSGSRDSRASLPSGSRDSRASLPSGSRTSGSASRASGSGSRASSSRAIPLTKAADQTFVEVSGSRASGSGSAISPIKAAGQTVLEVSGSRASGSGSRASSSRAISPIKAAGQTVLEVEVAAPPVAAPVAAPPVAAPVAAPPVAAPVAAPPVAAPVAAPPVAAPVAAPPVAAPPVAAPLVAAVAAPPAAYDPLALSLETTGVTSTSDCTVPGALFSQLVVAEDFRLSFLSIQQMKTIVFYYSHILRIEGYDWKSHAVLSSFVSCRMMPRMTIQQELEAARNRVRFDQGERCRGTYAGLFLTLLRTVAQLWVELEAQHFSLSRVLSIKKESLKMYCQIFDASLL
ncbi:putative pistil-specific extensin-like protein [Rosa chinensis]|uniref:Putative pistil-specific extensin-like protein n=1 Tax=Rosa chinensis TaxID=74649 RepID=A0A2P6RER2_ROSCH|nr:putative pistil-specific extensin-like protein [Rosa chinensis]